MVLPTGPRIWRLTGTQRRSYGSFWDTFAILLGARPAAGFELVVFTRFDTEDVGARPPFRMRICAQAGNQGERLQLHLYNSSGTGIIGFHHDPMTRAHGRGAASLVCSEGGRSTADMDLVAGDTCAAVEPVSSPVLQERARETLGDRRRRTP